MNHRTNRTNARGLAISATVLAMGVGPALAQPASDPDEVVLAGQVRDFLSTHPDFGLSSAVGGPVTGLIEYYGTAGRPQLQSPFTGTELTQNALDAAGQPIAPHMFANGPENTGVLVLKNEITASGNSTSDSYDPLVGYDEDAANDLPPIDPVGDIADIYPPVFSPPIAKSADVMIKNNKTGSGYILSGDLHTDSFTLWSSIMTVDGDVVLHVEDDFTVRTKSTIIVPDGSSLTVYLGGSFLFENSSIANFDTWDHGRLKFMNYGTTTMVFENHTDVVATIVSPNAAVELSNSAEFYGAVTANELIQDNSSGLHIAGEFAWVSDCFFADDTQAAAGNASAGQITSGQSFASWFSETPDVTAVDNIQLLLTDDGTGAYEVMTTSFEPINDELLGDEGGAVNRNFTVDVSSIFFNRDCANNFIEVETSMDCWVFIDDVMVIDLGGTTATAMQRIDLDRLGLADSTWHRVRIFMAQRLDGPQDLRIRTTIPLTPPRNFAVRTETRHD